MIDYWTVSKAIASEVASMEEFFRHFRYEIQMPTLEGWMADEYSSSFLVYNPYDTMLQEEYIRQLFYIKAKEWLPHCHLVIEELIVPNNTLKLKLKADRIK